MNVKKILSVLMCSAAVTTSFMLPSVNVSADEDSGGNIRKISVFRKSLDEKETVDCMFYDDMPDIPYMAIDVYYKTFLDGEMTVSKQADGKYLCREKNFGETAVIDVGADTLTSDKLILFIATPIHKSPELESDTGGPELITKVLSIKCDKKPETVTVDYKKYGIDIREKDGKVYLPFGSLSDLFGNTDCVTAVYRNGNIYFMAYFYDINGGDAINSDRGLSEWLDEGIRSKQQAEFAYNELCLCYDYFYGYPCLHNDFSDRMSEVGLDRALEELAPETKKLLKSEASGEYLAGLCWLTEVELADGGHSGIVSYGLGTSLPEKTTDDLWSNLPDINSVTNHYIEKDKYRSDNYYKLYEIRKSAVGDEDYHAEGDTMLIRFDSFRVDYDGWKDYFSGKTDSMPEDSISIVYNNLRRAKSDSKIKNVVFDLTTNGGGDTIALDWICASIFGKNVYREYIPAGDYSIKAEVICDKNLDGKIDEKDDEINYDGLNFGVLTSRMSFSCGNLFPAMFRNNGCMVLGEQSGGGGCCVLQKATADGVVYRMSGYLNARTSDGASIDDGIPVDAELAESGNYSSMYDIQAISREMNAFYAGKHKPSEESSEVSEPSEISGQSKSSEPGENSGQSESSEPGEISEPSEHSAEVSRNSSSGNDLTAAVLWAVLGTLFAVSLTAVIITILVSRKKQ